MATLFLGDLHFGKPANNYVLDNVLVDWFTSEFDKIVEENHIDTVIQAGDVFDTKTINSLSIMKALAGFYKKVLDNKKIKKLIQVVGNHDCIFKNRSDINTPEIFLSLLEDNRVIFVNDYLYIPELDMDVFGWNGHKKDHTPMGSYCVGHFEIVGFEMSRGILDRDGTPQEFFSKYEKVFSGHYHRPSKKGNIEYIGSLFDVAFGEEDVDHFAGVWDGKNLKKIITPKIHQKVVFEDRATTGIYGRIIKLITSSIETPEYQEYVEHLRELGFVVNYSLLSAENFINGMELTTEELQTMTMQELIHMFIDGFEFTGNINKNVMKGLMDKLYSKALEEIG
jgi:DNA repair exonuclease SbcCD nuclease subunit